MATKSDEIKGKAPNWPVSWEVTDKISFVWGLVFLEPRVEQARQDQGLVGRNPCGFSDLPDRYQVFFHLGFLVPC